MTANAQIARQLTEVADLLRDQGANAFRVQAYRRGAETVARLNRPASEILEQDGLDALRKLPGIGERLTIAIRDIVRLGRLPMLARLRGESDPEELLRTVAGVGHIHARRLHEELGIDSLEDLEAAAHDGRLANIEGLGPKRLTAIQDSLAARLGRFRTAPAGALSEPSVEELLDVDREYLRRLASGELHKIAPRRFNPQGDVWLPILHTQRGERHYTALFSNTAHAHKLGKTRDWVILYYDGRGGERQATVITSQYGQLKGKRMVRGREEECCRSYGSGLAAGN